MLEYNNINPNQIVDMLTTNNINMNNVYVLSDMQIGDVVAKNIQIICDDIEKLTQIKNIIDSFQ